MQEGTRLIPCFDWFPLHRRSPLSGAACGRIVGIDEINYVPPKGGSDEASSGPQEKDSAEPSDEHPTDAHVEMSADSSVADGSAVDAGNEREVKWSPWDRGSSLVLWLDGSNVHQDERGNVTTWPDWSGYGNDARASMQPPPTYEGSAAPNMHGAVKFDVSTSYLPIADAPSLQWGRDDFLIEVVAEYANPPSPNEFTGYACFFNKVSSAAPFYGVSFNGNAWMTDTDASSSTVAALTGTIASPGWVPEPTRVGVIGTTRGLNDQRFHLVGLRRKERSTLEVRLDGTSDGVNTSIADIDVSAFGKPAYIGGYIFEPSVLHALHGHVAEVIAVRGPISASDLEGLETHLKAKYGL